MHQTSSTLLSRLRQGDDAEAWSRFRELYSALIAWWVRESGVPSNDVEDVEQEVFVALFRALSTNFAYDRSRGRFRDYLRQTVRSRVCNYWKRVNRQPPHYSLAEESDHPLDESAQRAVAAEYRRFMLQRCLEAVRGDFDPTTWDLFLIFSLGQDSAKEIARNRGISPQEVYRCTYRVVAALRKYAAELDPDLFEE